MIRFNSVSFRYSSGRTILNAASFHIRPGAFHFVTGPSGSGKSTLLRLFMMSLQPSRGSIGLFGQDVTRIEVDKRAHVRRRMGVIFQDNPMLSYLTVRANCGLPMHVLGKRETDYREDLSDLLAWVGLSHCMDAYPETLSGGELQRAGIVRAIISKPELILADEPTASVDPQMARRLLHLFIELNRLGTTTIIATHDHQLMRQFRAPRLELHDGHVRIP